MVPFMRQCGKLQDLQVRADGMVINTMGWIDGIGYNLLLHSIKALKADVILVVGQDRLHSQLRNELRYSACQGQNLSNKISRRIA